MASFNKVNSFITEVCKGTHANAINAATDTLKVYLSNTAPNAATMAVKADLAEIANANGYGGPLDVLNTASQTGATITVAASDQTVTAAGGTVGPFRYVPLYNDTPTVPADPLWGWWDYGSALTLNAGETFTVDFGASLATFA